MDSIIKLIVKPDKFKTYRLIYNIKDMLMKYATEPEELCQMCFLHYSKLDYRDYNESDSEIEDDKVDFINRHGHNYTYNDLCNWCKKSNTNKIETCVILLLVYKFKKPRLNEIITMFKIKNPYSILLHKYENQNNHIECAHYYNNLNDWDGPEPCPIVLELIDNLTDLNDIYWICSYGLKYIDYFIKKGCKIDLSWIIYGFVDGESSDRLDKVIEFCDAETIKTALYRIAGKKCDPEKIKYLMKLGTKFNLKININFENHYLPPYDKMLFDTRLGKLIKSFNP